MSTELTLTPGSATNTPDTFLLVPQEKPTEVIDVRTDKAETYLFQGPYRTELVGSKERMEALADHPLYQGGWWERVTRVTTTVTERI